MKILRPGDRVDVDLEIMDEASGEWVTTTEEGKVFQYNEKEGEVTIYWDGDDEPYVCGSQFVKLSIKSGDIVVVENEIETDGVWENIQTEAVVIDPPNSLGEVTVKMIETGDLYTTPREYISSSVKNANTSFSQSKKCTSPADNSIATTSNRGSVRSTAPLARVSLDPSSYSDMNLSGEWNQKSSKNAPSLIITHVIGKSLALNGKNYLLDGNTRMDSKKRRSTWASTTTSGIEIVHEDKNMKVRKVITLSKDGGHIQIVETKSKASSGLVLSKDVLSFSKSPNTSEINTNNDEQSGKSEEPEKVTTPRPSSSSSPASNDSESIPVSRFELRDTMAREIPKDQHSDFYKFCASISALVDSQYSELPEVFNTTESQQLSSLLKLCAAANYVPLTPEQWSYGVTNRVKTTDQKTLLPDLASFLSQKQEVFSDYFSVNPYRWDTDSTEPGRDAIPEFAHNVVVLTKGQPNEENDFQYSSVVVAEIKNDDDNDESLSVSLYQDIPRSDVALLLPNSGMLLPFMSRIYFIGSVLPVLFFIYYGIINIEDGATPADLSIEYLLCLVAFMSGCVLKLCGLLYTFSFMKITLAGSLSDWRCQRAKARSDVALQTLVMEAVDQETKEILLAYYILWRSTESCLPAYEVKQRLAAFFEKHFPTIRFNFEFNDAIHKLILLKLAVTENSKGYYKLGLSPKQFLASKSQDWTGLLSNHFGEVIDARLR
eukprot:TRINITY_DN1019_c8_g1_i1.p1 TRINITY_DN1019_c8_g1~~TRINITY_DN1019_c8_g1_i1.p1  ORF type:complete len:716 (+),score=145.93 TRINITY_DN1019_c8_g1_i1:49-2196(+)